MEAHPRAGFRGVWIRHVSGWFLRIIGVCAGVSHCRVVTSSSAADEISGEPVAIKMVTRALEKVALAKRVLREITLLRHFAHENITGLIDVDCSTDLSEMHVFHAIAVRTVGS